MDLNNKDDPLRWKLPNNNNNSCYVNSALWGLLYNDSFIGMFKNVNYDVIIGKKCSNDQIKQIPKLLETYKKGILNSTENMNSAVEEIRGFFNSCANDTNTNWESQVGDPGNFLTSLDELFISKTQETITNIISKNNSLKNNYVIYTENTITKPSKTSKVSIEQYTKAFGKKPQSQQKLNYTILPIINISYNDNDDIDIITNSEKKIEVISEEEIQRENTNTSYNDLFDGTTTHTTGKSYNYINSTKSITQNYELNNNYQGIIITYKQGKNDTSSYEDQEQIWNNLNKIKLDKYYKIGRYQLCAFSCWTSFNHYTCYFKFKDKWYLMNDTASNIIEIEINDNFKEKLFGNSFTFFYEYIDSLDYNINILCSKFFNYDTTKKELVSTTSSTSPSSILTTSSNKPEQYVNINTGKKLVVYNTCDKAGQDWLDLFTDKNMVLGPRFNIGSDIIDTNIGKIIKSTDDDGKEIEKIVIVKSCPSPDNNQINPTPDTSKTEIKSKTGGSIKHRNKTRRIKRNLIKVNIYKKSRRGKKKFRKYTFKKNRKS